VLVLSQKNNCPGAGDAAEYPDLVAKYAKLNWRIISKPGGATVKPDHFYQLYGYALIIYHETSSKS